MYKSTNFLANHNSGLLRLVSSSVVVGCTKVLISQLITTCSLRIALQVSCCWMYKSTNFLANHNCLAAIVLVMRVVVGCTKVLISQLITTKDMITVFSDGCCWMYKSTNFLANHNAKFMQSKYGQVVVGCTKVLISQLITTQ